MLQTSRQPAAIGRNSQRVGHLVLAFVAEFPVEIDVSVLQPPPSGLLVARDLVANVMNDRSAPVVASKVGKNNLFRNSADSVPKKKKSYPSAVARMSVEERPCVSAGRLIGESGYS